MTRRTCIGQRDIRQRWAYRGTIDACTSTAKIVISTVTRHFVEWRKLWWRWEREIYLEWTSNGLLVAEELEERSVIFGASSNEIHSISVGNSNLYIFAAIKKSLAILLRHKEVQWFNSCLSCRRRLSGSYVQKCRLVWWTWKGTKERAKIVPTSWASWK